jgi:hypothetical protein
LLRARDISVCVLIVFLISLRISRAQQDKQKPQSSMGGIASGVVAALIYDSQNRPITAGGFVDKGPVIFEDAAKQAGLGSWRHKMGVPEKNFIVETNGSGVCLIDFDNDGWLDIYLVNGATFDSLDERKSRHTPHCSTTTMTEPLLTWLKKPVCNWVIGLQVQRGATMTVMGYWICMSRVMFTSTARTCRSAEARR